MVITTIITTLAIILIIILTPPIGDNNWLEYSSGGDSKQLWTLGSDLNIDFAKAATKRKLNCQRANGKASRGRVRMSGWRRGLKDSF
jgi:hypothetical protein